MRLPLLCSLLVACGFDATTGGATAELDAPTGPDPIPGRDAASAVDGVQLTPQTFIEQLIREECVQAFLCKAQYPSGAATFATEWGTDLDDCVRTDSDYRVRDKIATAVFGGTITFDPTHAVTCLAAPGVPTTCATLFADEYPWADSCYAALLGHVADGAACVVDWECARGSECRAARCARS